ncbi:hypothetical protein [Lactococcus garvieae]|uniref:hypothetical protein n=1 Tax=Lactococcus garvieae TaxID=1363 RepID=UPI00254AA6F8|nr:hypothetical protein [Lactococcus garvieae]
MLILMFNNSMYILADDNTNINSSLSGSNNTEVKLNPDEDVPRAVLANSKSGDLIMYGEPNLYDTMGGDVSVSWWKTVNHFVSRRVIENFLNDRLNSSSEFNLGYRKGDKVTVPLNMGYWEGNTIYEQPSGINFTGRTNISSGGFPGGGQPYFEHIVPSMSGDRVKINNGNDYSLMIDAWDIPGRPASWTNRDFRSALSTNSTTPGHASLVPIFASRYGTNSVQYSNEGDSYKLTFYGDSSNSQWLEIERLNTTFTPNNKLPFESYIGYYGRYNTFNSQYIGQGRYNWSGYNLSTETGKFTVRGDVNTEQPKELKVTQNTVPTYEVGDKITSEEIQKNIECSGYHYASSLDILGENLNYTISSKDVGQSSLSFTLQESLDGVKRTKEFIFKFNVNKEDIITATPNSQSISLGSNAENIVINELVKDVKFGDIALKKDEYTVSLQNSITTDTVGTKIAQVKISYIADPTKTLSLDVPVQVLWGHTIGSNNVIYKTSTGVALSLIAETKPNIVATLGNGKNSGNWLNDFQNGTYITTKAYKDSQILNSKGTYPYINLEINGRDSARDAVNKWNSSDGRNTLAYGDIIQYDVLKDWGDNKWVMRDEQQQFESLGKQSIYYEITKDGYKTLHLNHLEAKNLSIPIYSTKEYLNEHINDYIDLRGYKNISVKEFSQYPDTKSSGQKKGQIIIEELLTTGKKVQFEYEVTFTVGEGQLSYSVPELLEFKDLSKSKIEQLVQRKNSKNLGISVNDSRGSGKQGNWQLTARVEQAEDLSPYLIFKESNSQEKYLNQGAVEIYSQSKQEDPQEPLNIDVSEEWTENNGLLLRVPAKNDLLSQQYSSVITWNLVEGP